MSCAVTIVTDEGASITLCSCRDAPYTTSTCNRSSSERSVRSGVRCGPAESAPAAADAPSIAQSRSVAFTTTNNRDRRCGRTGNVSVAFTSIIKSPSRKTPSPGTGLCRAKRWHAHQIIGNGTQSAIGAGSYALHDRPAHHGQEEYPDATKPEVGGHHPAPRPPGPRPPGAAPAGGRQPLPLRHDESHHARTSRDSRTQAASRRGPPEGRGGTLTPAGTGGTPRNLGYTSASRGAGSRSPSPDR